jgi:tRNA(fMet)-specific endonuclease VapC
VPGFSAGGLIRDLPGDACGTGVRCCKERQTERNKEALTNFLAPLEIAPFDDFAAICYGEIRTHPERSGLSIGAMDLMIASHARSLDVVLVSNNPREFQRVPGLKVENRV